jgi:hypothetical protein
MFHPSGWIQVTPKVNRCTQGVIFQRQHDFQRENSLNMPYLQLQLSQAYLPLQNV